MAKSAADIATAAEAYAKQQAGIFLKANSRASKQEIFQKAFLLGMQTGVEMLTYKGKKEND
ncbi:hypothetical protein PGJ95_01845 [Acinetobacter baumannii]|uniref:hypothetical protein n=1 Tax=Acinetobacter calcoaceticus/baumannii complex TaxID=909768 RepID=UPI0005EBA896|nr:MULTISPECIES: hypothetical protein [Acinetobacter calcoaceticus/baumannii complex]MCF4843660.1 hypothetical protein [Acinetobacter baumannii]MDA4857577.1 hypothetical protein [Acinetobacter baumannii]MDA4907651.1 hypothetical protein [Acinetobacter baumannii]MDA4911430.1 hypothetical protein [Acinetobacter baumannii]MDA4936898.1 hypothetical protein [Acinetobacter baumannii]